MNLSPPHVKSTCFYKMIGSSSSEARKLQIPPAFWIKTKQSLRSGPVFLRKKLQGPVWPAQLVDQEQGVYLRDGWTVFFKNNNLGEGDLLLFTHLQGPHVLVEVCLQDEPTPVHATPERNEDIHMSSARRSRRKEYYPNDDRFVTPAAGKSTSKKPTEVLKPSGRSKRREYPEEEGMFDTPAAGNFTSKKPAEILKPSGRSMRKEYPEEGRFGISKKGGITIKEPTKRRYVDDYSDEYAAQYEFDEGMFGIPRKGGITIKEVDERMFGIPRKGGITIKEPTEGHYVDSNSDSDSDEYANQYVDDNPENRHQDYQSFMYATHYEIGESSKRREEKGKAKMYDDAGMKYNKRR